MTKARDIASAIPAPSTVSSAELGHLDGVTSAIQTQLDAKTAKSTLTTTGDIYYASAANTPARLGIGSSAQVLTVASGVPSWATPSSGGMTLISTTTLTGASVTIGSIPGTYKDLRLVIQNFKPATDAQQCYARFNSDSGTRYRLTQMVSTANATFNGTRFDITEAADNTVASNLTVLNVYDYANTVTWKFAESRSITVNDTTTTNVNITSYLAVYNQTAAITDIVLLTGAGNFTSGTAYLYGVQ